jgi:hypothetical protein
MKKKFLLIVFAVMLLMAAPAAAKRADPVGEEINVLWWTPTSYPAGDPFHVQHGWLFEDAHGYPMGKFDFELFLDGAPQDCIKVIENRPYMKRTRLCNYRDGLPAGPHTFVGNWIAPCQYALDYGYTSSCAKPNDPFVVFTQTLIVDFTPPSP